MRKLPKCEALEERQMLSGAGTDYVLSGFTWSNPKNITYSIPADGVSWDQGANNLNARLNADYGGPAWKREVARALQTWASVANINIVQTTDSNADFNTSGLSQGDPHFGDIRIGGYDLGNHTTLAETYYPPPNGVTAAGDVEVNTGFTWGPNASYDLYSVLLHETGHSLGMAHSPQPSAVMNATYGGLRTGLTPFDVEGIQAMYGARTPDTYEGAGQGVSSSTAIDLTSGLGNTRAETLWNLSLATVGDTEYFSVVAPSGLTNESLQAIASASGISLLSPKVSVYDSSMNLVGSNGDANAWGDDATLNLSTIQPGQRYTIAVTGATNDVFAVGSYALKLNFAGTATPTPAPPAPLPTPPPVTPPPVTPPPVTPPPVTPPPVTPPPVTPPPVTPPPVTPPPVTPPPVTPPPVTPPPVTPPVVSPPVTPPPVVSPTVNLGTVSSTNVTGQSLPTSSNVNVYTFVVSRNGTVVVATGTTAIHVVNQFGQVIASGTGQVSFQNLRAGTRYYLVVATANGSAVPQFNLAIVVILPTSRVLPRSAPVPRRPARKAREVVTPHAGTASNPGLAGSDGRPVTVRIAQSHPRAAVVSPRWSKSK